jgi:hypothetical protein
MISYQFDCDDANIESTAAMLSIEGEAFLAF